MQCSASAAQAIGADKSRIISDLDELQERGLIKRQPDDADRRVHLLWLTPEGSALQESVQSAIRRREKQILALLPPGDREAFLRSLQALSELPPDAAKG